MQNAATEMAKDFMFRVRLDEHENRMLQALAEYSRESQSTVVRRLIKERYASLASVLSPGPEHFGDEHRIVLETLAAFATKNKRAPRRIAGAKLGHEDFLAEVRARARANKVDVSTFSDGVNRFVNDLHRWGYLRRVVNKQTGVISFAVAGDEEGDDDE